MSAVLCLWPQDTGVCLGNPPLTSSRHSTAQSHSAGTKFRGRFLVTRKGNAIAALFFIELLYHFLLAFNTFNSPQEAILLLVLLRVKFLGFATGEDEEDDCGHHVDGGGDVVHYLPSEQKLQSLQGS